MSIKKDYFSLTPDIKIYYELHSTSELSSNSSTKILMIMGAYATLRLYDELVEYLVEHYPSPVEILTYDHRGIGNSKISTTSVRNERQTSKLLAHDAYQLINHVWNNQVQVHVLGMSLGGSIAQELALLLVSEQRLLSLYLGITTRGKQNFLVKIIFTINSFLENVKKITLLSKISIDFIFAIGYKI